MHDQIGGSVSSVLDDVAILTVTGQLDFALCVRIAPELDAALRSPARAIVIDLEGVSLVDSSGIALMINAFAAWSTRDASSPFPARADRSGAPSS